MTAALEEISRFFFENFGNFLVKISSDLHIPQESIYLFYLQCLNKKILLKTPVSRDGDVLVFSFSLKIQYIST